MVGGRCIPLVVWVCFYFGCLVRVGCELLDLLVWGGLWLVLAVVWWLLYC